MNRIDILNAIIQKKGFTKYCEIGVQKGDCFRGVQCETKIGVDPDETSAANVKLPSDAFFETLKQYEENKLLVSTPEGQLSIPKKFDIFWIDGLHHADQVERDILNALDHLEEGGVICCHDMHPTDEFMTQTPQTTQDCWTGDCYKAFVKLRSERDDVEMVTIATDWGCGIIWKGKQEKLNLEGKEINFANFWNNKEMWMNVRSEDWFNEVYIKQLA